MQNSDYDIIMNAISAGDIKALEEFSEMLDDFPSGKDNFIGRHWITNAIDCGTEEVVYWMLDNGAPIIYDDDEGFSILHTAIDRTRPGKYEIMEEVIKRGADLNVMGQCMCPIHLAAGRDDLHALKILHKHGADFSHCTVLPYQSLYEVAVEAGSKDVIEWLEKERL